MIPFRCHQAELVLAYPACHGRDLPVVFRSGQGGYHTSCQVPPAGLLPPAEVPAPYLCSPQEISALIHAAGTLAIPIQAATYHALICLLAVSGMRVGEALALDVADVDLDAGVITVTGKYDRTRLVPLHPTTAAMLRDYRQRCDEFLPVRRRNPPLPQRQPLRP